MKAQISKQFFAGKFEIHGEIAKGQTGTILYGYDLGLRQEVAIKVYHSHINGRLVRGKTFIEKSKPLLLIDHPNLIKIFNVEEQNDNPVVFMEFFDAPSLHHIIHNKGVLSVQEMLLLVREITEVFIHTHFQGIIHGTLHPGHVLVGPKGQVKVMDLGLSWILMDILPNCEPELFRPLPYFPPEIAKGEPLNISSDLYCLGFMMYEMLTGTVPYTGLPKTSIMGKLAFDQTDPIFNFPETVPDAVCDLIRDMSRNKAQDRLQDATHILTIINQQLAKLTQDEEHGSPQLVETTATSRAQTASPADDQEHANAQTSMPSNSLTTEKPSLKKTPSVQRPRSAVDYGQVRKAQRSRKIGITIVWVLLLGMAGSLGYWYRDYIEPHLSGFPLQVESASPAKGFPRNTPIETEETSAPIHNEVPIHESQIGEEEPTYKELLPLPSKQIEQNGLDNPTPLSPPLDVETSGLEGTSTEKTPQEQPGTSLLPTKKQPTSAPLSTSEQEIPPPTRSSVEIPPPGKDTDDIPLTKPTTTKASEPRSAVPTAKLPPSKLTPTPQQQLPVNTPVASDVVTPPTAKPLTNETPKTPISLKPSKETISQKKESSTSTPPPTDKAPILGHIDPSPTQSSSANEIPPVEKP